MALPQFQKTSYGIRMMNQRLYDGTSFQITHYQIGAGGHDATTNQPIPVDTALLELPSATTGTIALTAGSVIQTAYDTLQFTLTLGKGVGTGAVSNVGLWASSGVNSDGTLISPFLFAIANLGYRTKLANETHEYVIELVS